MYEYNLVIFARLYIYRLAELANQIPAILDMINKMTGNSSALSTVISMEAQLAYQTYTIQQFIIKQLQFFNGKCFRFPSHNIHVYVANSKSFGMSLILYCKDLL